VRILAAAFQSARGLSGQYGNKVTVEELAAAIHNAGQDKRSKLSSFRRRLPNRRRLANYSQMGLPNQSGTAEFNACRIKDYACNVVRAVNEKICKIFFTSMSHRPG